MGLLNTLLRSMCFLFESKFTNFRTRLVITSCYVLEYNTCQAYSSREQMGEAYSKDLEDDSREQMGEAYSKGLEDDSREQMGEAYSKGLEDDSREQMGEAYSKVLVGAKHALAYLLLKDRT